MNGRKTASFVFALVLIAVTVCCPFISSATFFFDDKDVVSCPGNTRIYRSADTYNYAWLDTVIMRDDSSSVTPLTLRPVCDYPYSHTCEEFVSECVDCMALFDMSETVIEDTVNDILKRVYLSLVATGIVPDNMQSMREYNESRGIRYPYVEGRFTDIYTVITYGCLKGDIYKLFNMKEIVIPYGTTVEEAVVRYLCALCGMEFYPTEDSVSSFCYRFADDYVLEDSNYPVSENASEDELLYWLKVKACEESGYTVPSGVAYDSLSAQQYEYVGYAYFASILTAKYDVRIDPSRLKVALNSVDSKNEVPKLVLKSMLKSKGASYEENDSMDKLFNAALGEGFFALDNEFYTDVFEYEAYVKPECEKVWLTCIPVADQLEGGKNSLVKTYLNGKLVENQSTNFVTLSEGDETSFYVKTVYTDGAEKSEAVYKFKVIKTGDSALTEGKIEIDMSDPIGSVVSAISDAKEQKEENTVTYEFSEIEENTFTTYPTGEGAQMSSVEDIIGTYPDSEGDGYESVFVREDNAEQTSSVVLNVVNTVKENPAVAAAPVGLLAFGVSAGYVFTRKRKDDAAFGNDEYEER